MPTTLPVPSKGALRALRNLALGTSCTVAFTTGVITDDRRRRIHTVQKVNDNAKKIKSSRHYHGSGTAGTLDDQIMRYRDESFWQANRRLSTSTATAETPDKQTLGHGDESIWPASMPPLPVKTEVRPNDEPGRIHIGSLKTWAPTLPTGQELAHPHRIPRDVRFAPRPPTTTSRSVPKARPGNDLEESTPIDSRQYNLALDIVKLLESGVTPANLEAATSRFLNAFEEGLPVNDSGINETLLDAAARLSRASIAQKRLDIAEEILRIVLNHGKIDMEVFLSFNPEAVIKGLIREQPNHVSGGIEAYKENLRKACSLYLTKLKTRPNAVSSTMLSLGETLCEQTCRYELFDLAEGLYWRVESYSDSSPPSLVKHLIAAAHGREQHAKVLRYFKRFYIQTCPSQVEFFTTVGIIMESAIYSGRPGVSEVTLISAVGMAQREGLSLSTTWFLKVLGHDWRSHRDITRTRALFERLQPHLHLTGHPQAAYGAIIQFCIEADDEPAATTYYGILRQFHDLTAADVRIHGHFALAKAMRHDWSGVKKDLDTMSQIGPDLKEFSASFTPILRLFAQSHDVNDTEAFLLDFMDQCGGLLTPSLSTTMIDEYVKAGEFDSVSRWLDYMTSVNCHVDSSFFNVILKDCYHKFNLSHEEVFQLYQSVEKLGARTGRFVNNDTFSTLRQIAMASSGKNLAGAAKRLKYLKLHVPIKRLNCSRDIMNAMTAALSKNKPARALKIYRRALDDQILLSESAVTMAVKATLALNPQNVEATAILLQDSQQNGQNVRFALSSMFVTLVSELNYDLDSTPDAIKDMARSTISSLDDRGISVPTGVITHTMSMLVGKHQYQQALDFWNSMSQRQGHAPITLDLHALTTILQAYVGLADSDGVEWAVRALSTNAIIPDRRFQRTLSKAYKKAKKCIAPHFTHACLQALNTVDAMRIDATQEKENARMSALKIMERAIFIENGGQPTELPDSEPSTDKLEMDVENFRLTAGSAEGLVYYNAESVRGLDNVLQPRLVGVATG